MIEIDGTHGEGGGAILRTALALSTITGKPFRITNIRHGRPQPGLKREHLYCIRILQELSGAKVEDAHLESEQITFIPGEIKNKKVLYDLETAASATLVSQCIILATIFSGKRVHLTLQGGTDVKWSIPADYLANVLAPMLKPIGDVKVNIRKRGYFPKGQGVLELTVKGHDRHEGSTLPRLEFVERGNLLKIEGVAHASAELEAADVARRLKEMAELSFNTLNKPTMVRQEYSQTHSTGAILTLWARCGKTILASDALGEKGVPAEKLAERAAKELKDLLASEAVVDPYLADQLIPYLGMCGGALKTSTITEHVKSNIYVTEQFLDATFLVDETEAIVQCGE